MLSYQSVCNYIYMVTDAYRFVELTNGKQTGFALKTNKLHTIAKDSFRWMNAN